MHTETPDTSQSSERPTGPTGTRPQTSEMIERFKRFFGYRFDTELARKLGLSDGSAIGNWRRRDSIDLLLIADCCPEINIDWLIWGRGTRTAPPPPEKQREPRDSRDYLQATGIHREQIITIVHEALEEYLKKTGLGTPDAE